MKKMISVTMFIFTLTLAVPVFLHAQDPLEIAPEVYTKLFENDQVRVLEARIKPGAQVAEHSHPNHFGYPMSDATLSLTKNGETKEVQVKAGEVIWIDAETHSTVNHGTTEFHGLVVELK